MLKFFVRAFGLVIAAILALSAFSQQKAHARDEFFWLGQMNKATAVINTDEGLLDKAIAPRIAAGVAKVIEDGNKPGAAFERFFVEMVFGNYLPNQGDA